MIAIDTNVLVRLLVNDDAEQARRAADLFQSETIFIATTVILETEWVLRSHYRYRRDEIHRALSGVANLGTVVIETPERLMRALDAFAAGMDFADALHLAAAGDCEAFATFDTAVRKVGMEGGPPVRMA